jgi:hypothetical protein
MDLVNVLGSSWELQRTGDPQLSWLCRPGSDLR